MKYVYILILTFFSGLSQAQNSSNNNAINTDDSGYMSKELFDLVAQWQQPNSNPNINLIDFVNSQTQSLAVRSEATELTEHFNRRINGNYRGGGSGTAGSGYDRSEHECACEVTYSLTSTGTDFNYQDFTQIDTQKRKEFLFASRMNGAAHSSNLTRYIRHADNIIDDQRSDNVVLISQMTCMSLDSNTCSSGSCSGTFNYIVDYNSQLSAYTETSGGILSGSHAISSDAGLLTYDSTTEPLQTLFNKAIMLNKEESFEFNEDSFLSLLEGIIGLTAQFAGDGIGLTEIDTQLALDTVSGLLGLFTNHGSEGSINKNFVVQYNSLLNPPKIIYPGNVSSIVLTSVGRVFGRGWGGFKSWSKAKYGSAYAMAGSVNNFVCDDKVLPPNENGFWSYGNADGPISTTTIINNVISYLELMIPGFNKHELVALTSHHEYMDYSYPVELDEFSVKIKNKAYGKCIYPYGWGGIPTVRFYNWGCGGSTFAFNVIDVDADTIKLQSQELNMCMGTFADIDGIDEIRAVDCASPFSAFSINYVTADEFILRSQVNGKCLIGNPTNGGFILQQSCTGDSNSVFTFESY
jgi:hypothetical protein